MSVKETSIGRGSVKKALRRKLTGPPHLLLGKSKMKNGTGSRSLKARRHNGSKDSCNMTDVSVPSCEEKICEEVAAKLTTEPQRHSAENKGKKEEVSIKKTKSPSMDQNEIVADQSDQNGFIQKLTSLKRVFSPSVICFRCTRKPGETGDHDEDEYHAVTFFNRQTRDSVDLTAHSAGVNSVSAAGIQQHSSTEYKSSDDERETIKTKTFRFFKCLIIAPKYPSKSSGSDKSLWYDGLIPCSLKKQPRPFWMRRAQKPSPFFQERIEETKEYIEEETIVLANRHVDDHIAKSMTLSPYLENEVKRHCPEMLTVSVDVSAITLQIKGTTDTSEAAKASETPPHISSKMKVIVEPQGHLGEGLIGGKEIQMNPSPRNSIASQAFRVCQNLDGVREQQGIINPNINSNTTASEHPILGEQIRLCATSSDSNTIGQNASAGKSIDSAAGKIPGGVVTDDGTIMEDLYLDMSDGVQSYGTEQRPILKSDIDTCYLRMAHAEENAEQGCDKREIFMLEMACCVVQVAIKAALDQFKDELMDSATSLDQLD